MTSTQTNAIARAYKDAKTVLVQITAEDHAQQQIVFELAMAVGAMETLLLRQNRLSAVERVRTTVKELEAA